MKIRFVNKSAKCSARWQDDNSCTVNALSITTGTKYEVCYRLVKASGRPKGEGYFPRIILDHCKQYGINSTPVLKRKVSIKTFCKNNPKGKFYVATDTHAFAIVDGVVKDWRLPEEINLNEKLDEAYKITGKYNGKRIRKINVRKLLQHLEHIVESLDDDEITFESDK